MLKTAEQITTDVRLALVECYHAGRLREMKLLAERLERSGNVEEAVTGANNLALVEWREGHYARSLEILLIAAPLLDACADLYAKANYHLTRANTLERIAVIEQIPSYFDRALIEYEACRYFFIESGNYFKSWHVENNIAFLFIESGQPEKAHVHLAKARGILFQRGGDDEAYRLAEIDDTEALAFLAEGKLKEAFEYSTKSILALYGAGEPKTLQASMETMRKILAATEGSK